MTPDAAACLSASATVAHCRAARCHAPAPSGQGGGSLPEARQQARAARPRRPTRTRATYTRACPAARYSAGRSSGHSSSLPAAGTSGLPLSHIRTRTHLASPCLAAWCLDRWRQRQLLSVRRATVVRDRPPSCTYTYTWLSQAVQVAMAAAAVARWLPRCGRTRQAARGAACR